jgi:hypothetical protein
MDAGILAAGRTAVSNPLPNSWLGRADAPIAPPTWTTGNNALTSKQIRNLLAQIAYDQSAWNYALIGNNNRLGRYQFDTTVLEQYGLLATGSNAAYGSGCVNYRNCWRQTTVKNATNSYANYLYNITNLNGFLTSTAAQEHLAYQRLLDLNYQLSLINAVTEQDSVDMLAGMMYVGWILGVGTSANNTTLTGTGAYAWRYHNIGAGATYYNAGRYAVTVLGQ